MNRLQLLHDMTGAFRPSVLTALMGVSGAGKTSLLDVLAGRKTSGSVEGEIIIGGYLKTQSTFARVSCYCEQTDVHSPQITVEESVIFPAWLRLDSQIDSETKHDFMEEVLETIELDEIKDTLVGMPTVSGLSFEQRKRLTIAMELVANPSIIFMDELTTGLDARSAAIVMRAQSLAFTVITYPMIGYYWSMSKVLWYCYTMFCTLSYFTYQGMFLVSVTPSFPLAAIVQSMFYSMYNLFAGFVIPRPQIPKWWIWFYYVVPTSWTMNGMLTSQYGDIEKEINVFGENKSIMAAFLKNFFGFQHSLLPLVWL